MASAFNRTDYLILSWIGTDAEAARYAIASRAAGPVLIGLGSLNNSLFVHQVAARGDRRRIAAMTRRAALRLAVVTLALVPLSALAVAAMGLLSSSVADRRLVVPTVLLVTACVPFAVAIPWGYAFNALGQEPRWMRVLIAGLVLDAILVVLVGVHGATWTAVAWLVTQTVVLGATLRQRRPIGLAR